MKAISIGEDNFSELIKNNKYYVDKTKILEEIITNGSKVTLFPRPRRFGKSLMISMLENFFDIERESKELLIDWKYPVFFSFVLNSTTSLKLFCYNLLKFTHKHKNLSKLSFIACILLVFSSKIYSEDKVLND